MSFVVAEAEMVQAAARSLAGLRSTLSEATVAAAAPTTGVVAAAADEVSGAVAALFGAYGQEYQALSAHAQAFHGEFVNLLNAGAGAYLSTEAANAAQAVASAVNAPARGLLAGGAGARVAAATSALTGPYQNLFTNTVTNLQGLSTTWTNVTQPALLQAITTQSNPQPFLTALTTGNLQPLLATTAQFARGSANLFANLAIPATLSVTSMTQSNISLSVGLGLPSLLAFDAMGGPVNAALAMASSSTAILQAMQTGNPLAVFTAMVDAPANVTNAFLNGEATVPLPLPVPGLSAVMADVPFRGLLVPVQPFTTTATLPGSSLPSVTITGPPVGGLIPALFGYTPQLLAGAFS